jgi:hypothetical protein
MAMRSMFNVLEKELDQVYVVIPILDFSFWQYLLPFSLLLLFSLHTLSSPCTMPVAIMTCVLLSLTEVVLIKELELRDRRCTFPAPSAVLFPHNTSGLSATVSGGTGTYLSNRHIAICLDCPDPTRPGLWVIARFPLWTAQDKGSCVTHGICTSAGGLAERQNRTCICPGHGHLKTRHAMSPNARAGFASQQSLEGMGQMFVLHDTRYRFQCLTIPGCFTPSFWAPTGKIRKKRVTVFFGPAGCASHCISNPWPADRAGWLAA